MATKKFDTSMSVWGQLANLPDLAKAYLFQVRFLYESESPLSQLLDSDDLMIKARTAQLPTKEFGELETNYMGTKLLILSADMLIFGAISAYNSYVKELGAVLWIGMAIFIAIIVWYCIHLRKADTMFFNVNGKSGKSIKDKALNK